MCRKLQTVSTFLAQKDDDCDEVEWKEGKHLSVIQWEAEEML